MAADPIRARARQLFPGPKGWCNIRSMTWRILIGSMLFCLTAVGPAQAQTELLSLDFTREENTAGWEAVHDLAPTRSDANRAGGPDHRSGSLPAGTRERLPRRKVAVASSPAEVGSRRDSAGLLLYRHADGTAFGPIRRAGGCLARGDRARAFPGPATSSEDRSAGCGGVMRPRANIV